MRDIREEKALASEFSDKSRRVVRTGGRFLVPQKFDDETGEPLTAETFDVRKHLKSLNLNEIRFLKIWRETGWNDAEAANKACLTDDQAKRLVRKLVVFKREEERVKALADVPTPEWITAKHTENVFEGRLSDSQRDSLKELAKITGSYKQQNIQIQNNVFNLPALSPEQEAKLKEVYDTIAMDASPGEVAA